MPTKSAADNKTKPRKGSVQAYISGIKPAGRKEDAQILLDLMGEICPEPPQLWGPSIIGFGSYHYQYESGREGDSMLTGFAPRKANMVVYVMPGFSQYQTYLTRLGKHRTGASCLYLGRLSNVNLDVLKDLIAQSVQDMRTKYPTSG